MGSWAAATLPLNQLLSLPSLFSRESMNTCSRTCHVKIGKFQRSEIFCNCIGRKCSKAMLRAVDWSRTSSPSNVGVWEDPDDGSESEYDEEGQEAKENDLDFESDWEEEKIDDRQKAILYEDQLAKEIYQLLEPEERVILEQNPAPNLKRISTVKWAALHTLALSGQIHYLDQLLKNGANIDSVDKDGRTALHVSVIGKKEAVISHLLRKGANPHVKDKDGVTPLHFAVQVGALQTVKLLIKSNVDVNTSDNEGWTSLHVAMQSRSRDITKVLLVNGADKTRKNKDGKTPLDLCLAYGKDFKSYELANLLKLVPANRDL
ncbi:ankyrin repeat domain-containing protein EMB506, chloroplastic isoform X2 [Silene latifolia]|uniref:ankyrin repeat domain-containing protein EMB506, chloroplastic isoform X2 n=1 Tax=Silene latifolia TaxID=37657 RepID=UPI003D787DF7